MRVSEYYRLDRTQPSLDFVDVRIDGDVRVFVDPRALRLLPSQWAAECVSLVQDFFGVILSSIRSDQHDRARRLLSTLREPNETRLGFSRAKPRGRALGPQSSLDVSQALTRSEAVQSGLLEDLEDTVLMVEGISSDIVSDIATNLIREPLIHYTQQVCEYYGIPVVPDVNSGPLWDPARADWFSQFVRLPVASSRKLLLVPKAIVRIRLDYDPDEYYTDYILEHLREVELNANTELVRLLKSGRRRVASKDLRAKYGAGKSVIVQQTLSNPRLLSDYRRDKRQSFRPPLTHLQIAEMEGTDPPDWDSLKDKVLIVPTGRQRSADYESAVESLLSALFYPALVTPQVQHNIHQGRKRIDITYTNAACDGFFHWLGMHYPAANVFVECKNYNSDPANPELDQLAGRFSPGRGRFGLLVCRTIRDKELFIQRCVDTAHDDRGFIVPLDDADLTQLVEVRRSGKATLDFAFLRQRFDRLIM
jgi:hypothetical protein